MTRSGGKVIVIGAGIAGLCTAVLARRCGYDVEVIEQHGAAGGLATSWRRDGYTFETCLHWLVGCNPDGPLHAQWQQIFDIDKLTFVHPEEFVRLESEHGESLKIYSNVDRLEAELLRHAPEDAAEIRRFTAAVRRFAKFPMLDPSEPWPRKGLSLLRLLPFLPLLRQWSKLSSEAYGRRFKHKLLRDFFGPGETGRLSVIAVVMALGWMSERNAAYVVGGSQAIIRPILARLVALGVRLRLDSKVDKILVQDDTATGVRLSNGETIRADWVISAADGHATIYDMLGGRYADAATQDSYRTMKPFPSYVQVSLGVARDLSAQAGYVTRVLDTPFMLDPETRLGQLHFRFFHFDPTFAAPGKTAVTCFLPTYNFAFWTDLQRNDPAHYQVEKHRVAEAVLACLERMAPGVREAVEVIDVSTPATVIRFTGNWQGSMEGWLLRPGQGFGSLPNTLPRLRRFLMAGHWVMPGGGLPSGVMSARLAVRALCKQDHIPFVG